MTEEEVTRRLTENYPDSEIKVQDMNGGGSNFQVYVKSSKFTGLNRIKQHQAVMAVFADELKSGQMHAMTLKTEIKES